MLDYLLDLFGSQQFVNVDAVVKMILRFSIDLIATTLVVRGIYVRMYQWNEQVFTYFAFNTITFFLCLILRTVPVDLGFALGLFAVFGILRYRTLPIRIKDLTYLFVVIGIAILNAVANDGVSVVEILLINGVIVGMTFWLETWTTRMQTQSATINYDNPDLLLPGKEQELIHDLTKRTGLKVMRVEVLSVDLIRDTARINAIYCPVPVGQSNG